MAIENILHISDVHCGLGLFISQRQSEELVDAEPEKLLAALIAHDVAVKLQRKPTLVIVSGDLTQAGSPAEYKAAGRFLEFLLAELSAQTKREISRDEVIIVPGNHDININDNRKAWQQSKGRYKSAARCPQKFSKFAQFYKDFYRSSARSREFDLGKGYDVFRFASRNLVIAAFDSNRRTSHTRLKVPGWIYPHTVEDCIEELSAMKQSRNRFLVFHHNPVPAPEFPDMIQSDYLATANMFAETLAKGRVRLVFHGHRHANMLQPLAFPGQEPTGQKVVCVGAGSVGRVSPGIPGAASRYQLVEVDISGAAWRIRSFPRMLDLSSVSSGPKGPGRFHDDPTVKSREFILETVGGAGKRRINKKSKTPRPETPKTIGRPDKREARAQGETSGLIASHDDIDAHAVLQEFHAKRLLGLYDEALADLTSLEKVVTIRADKTLLSVLRGYIDVMRRIDQAVLSYRKAQKEIQRLLNALSESGIKAAFGTGALGEWAFRSELLRLEYLLLRFSKQFFIQSKQDAMGHSALLRDIYLKSGRRDLTSLYLSIAIQLDLQEYSWAKQSLMEAIAVAPKFAPFSVLMAQFHIKEYRFDRALIQLDSAQRCLDKDTESNTIWFWRAFCMYFMGNFEEAERLARLGLQKWPQDASLRNNYAFAKARVLLRDRQGQLWDDPTQAAEILDEFLDSIFEMGANDAAHFNYALVLFWAHRQGKLDAAMRVFEKRREDKQDLRREDLLNSDDAVRRAFERAKNAYLDNKDYFHASICSYFIERARIGFPKEVNARILDELVWDADNFVSFRHDARAWRRAFLVKDPDLRGPLDFDHLAILKRWARSAQPFSSADVGDGGGYFIKWGENGIVVNPGARFINHFQRRGYAVSEISAVVVSSADYSGYEELSRLLDLIAQSHSQHETIGSVEIYLDSRVLFRFPDLNLRFGNAIVTPQTLPDRPISICSGAIHIHMIPPEPTVPPTLDHIFQEGTTIVSLLRKGKVVRTIGFTANPSMSDREVEGLRSADIIVVSLGEVNPLALFDGLMTPMLRNDLNQVFTDDPLYKSSFGLLAEHEIVSVSKDGRMNLTDGEKSLETHRNSLGIARLLTLISYLKGTDKLIILSDLPGELGDKRHMLAKVLDSARTRGGRFLTGDLGLVVGIDPIKVLCELGFQLVPPDKVDEECAEGFVRGPVKHFCRSHRNKDGFGTALRLDL